MALLFFEKNVRFLSAKFLIVCEYLTVERGYADAVLTLMVMEID